MARGAVLGRGGTKFDFLTVNVELEPSDKYQDLVHKVARELQRSLDRNQAIKTLLKGLWDFIAKWEVMGVKYSRDSTPPQLMLEELAEKLSAIADAIKDEHSGIFIFIDEADKPPAETALGEFAKLLTERLAKRGANNVGLGIIGISNVLDKMRVSHESSVRIFTPIQLEPLAMDDRKRIVSLGLEEAARKNGVATAVTEDALESIADISEGYPYFIQQYAYSAFEQDTDDKIDHDDVFEGLTKPNGALELLGQRYFENMYTDEIKSDAYRKVLQVMAQHITADVTRQQILRESGLKEHTVQNAIAALKKRGSIIPVKGRAGVFRLPSRSFAVWIQAFKAVEKLESVDLKTPPLPGLS